MTQEEPRIEQRHRDAAQEVYDAPKRYGQPAPPLAAKIFARFERDHLTRMAEIEARATAAEEKLSVAEALTKIAQDQRSEAMTACDRMSDRALAAEQTVRIAELERERLDRTIRHWIEETERALKRARAAEEKLRGCVEVLGNILCCTPHVRDGQIIYDCGDPFVLVRDLLATLTAPAAGEGEG